MTFLLIQPTNQHNWPPLALVFTKKILILHISLYSETLKYLHVIGIALRPSIQFLKNQLLKPKMKEAFVNSRGGGRDVFLGHNKVEEGFISYKRWDFLGSGKEHKEIHKLNFFGRRRWDYKWLNFLKISLPFFKSKYRFYCKEKNLKNSEIEYLIRFAGCAVILKLH